MKISAVYKITNTITGDFYIGSSKDVKHRWEHHKWPSMWKRYPNNPMYSDFQKYGVDKFVFEILEEVEIEQLKEKEQEFIETLQPTYNNINAKGWDVERYKEYKKSNKYKESQRKARNKYEKSEKGKEAQRKHRQSEKNKECQRKYRQSEKGKESHRKSNKKYDNQLCCFNGEILTLGALRARFKRKGIPHPTLEAKKYLLNK